MAKSEEKETRTKTWTLVLYPESAPGNWRDIIDEHHIPWIESPLHDKDMTAAGEVKKPHWHILLMFGTLKSFDQVRDVAKQLKGPIPERCHDAKALVRYMAHMDDPNKVQYAVADIKAHGGADLKEMLRPSASLRYEIIDEILEYIDLNRVTEFKDVMNYARKNERDRWFPLLCDNTAYVVGAYIKSVRHCHPKFIKIDEYTGEIL